MHKYLIKEQIVSSIMSLYFNNILKLLYYGQENTAELLSIAIPIQIYTVYIHSHHAISFLCEKDSKLIRNSKPNKSIMEWGEKRNGTKYSLHQYH